MLSSVLLVKVRINCILILMSRVNFMLNRTENEKCFTTSGPGICSWDCIITQSRHSEPCLKKSYHWDSPTSDDRSASTSLAINFSPTGTKGFTDGLNSDLREPVDLQQRKLYQRSFCAHCLLKSTLKGKNLFPGEHTCIRIWYGVRL